MDDSSYLVTLKWWRGSDYLDVRVIIYWSKQANTVLIIIARTTKTVTQNSRIKLVFKKSKVQ
jgi:hypothetical protein